MNPGIPARNRPSLASGSILALLGSRKQAKDAVDAHCSQEHDRGDVVREARGTEPSQDQNSHNHQRPADLPLHLALAAFLASSLRSSALSFRCLARAPIFPSSIAHRFFHFGLGSKYRAGIFTSLYVFSIQPHPFMLTAEHSTSSYTSLYSTILDTNFCREYLQECSTSSIEEPKAKLYRHPTWFSLSSPPTSLGTN